MRANKSRQCRQNKQSCIYTTNSSREYYGCMVEIPQAAGSTRTLSLAFDLWQKRPETTENPIDFNIILNINIIFIAFQIVRALIQKSNKGILGNNLFTGQLYT